MASTLLFAPHNDDETIFAAYTVIRESPIIVICLKGTKDGGQDEALVRERESELAISELGMVAKRQAHIEQWEFEDAAPDWDWMRVTMQEMRGHFDKIYAPAVEEGGHQQHNMVGQMVKEVFGSQHVTSYLTYTRTHGRSRSSNQVPTSPDWIAAKLRALSCYESQIARPACRYWFEQPDLREWYA